MFRHLLLVTMVNQQRLKYIKNSVKEMSNALHDLQRGMLSKEVVKKYNVLKIKLSNWTRNKEKILKA